MMRGCKDCYVSAWQDLNVKIVQHWCFCEKYSYNLKIYTGHSSAAYWIDIFFFASLRLHFGCVFLMCLWSICQWRWKNLLGACLVLQQVDVGPYGLMVIILGSVLVFESQVISPNLFSQACWFVFILKRIRCAPYYVWTLVEFLLFLWSFWTSNLGLCNTPKIRIKINLCKLL